MLVFFWLESLELAKERVAIRVSEGGHHIPREVIERRYKKGLENFFNLYQSQVDEWMFFDNTLEDAQLIAKFGEKGLLEIENHDIWNKLRNSFTNERS